MTTSVTPIPAFDDNYLWLISTGTKDTVAVVDPGDANAVLVHLDAHNQQLGAIFITHHHWDHTNGIDELLKHHSVPVYGPKSDNIPQVTHPLKDGDQLTFNGLSFAVIEVPGHTLDHIAYFSDSEQTAPLLFCGDTLFAAGCGRLFEGEPKQLHDSLQRLANLPENTLVYCTHEYTLNNLAFASHIEPNNRQLQQRLLADQGLRQQSLPTLPSRIGLEKQTNPFLRCNHENVVRAVTEHLGKQPEDSVATFTALRQWKDTFVIG